MTARPTDVAKNFYQTVFQTGDTEAVAVLVADGFVDHAPWPGQPATREGLQAGTAEMRSAFPDLRVEPLKMIEEDDKVAVVVRISGTQHGEFMGHTPTGSTFEIEGVDILRIREGKLLEHWGVMDVQRMLAQLRLAPTNVN
jgi:steroid delta-isomerase-like uncharacterized protein